MDAQGFIRRSWKAIQFCLALPQLTWYLTMNNAGSVVTHRSEVLSPGWYFGFPQVVQYQAQDLFQVPQSWGLIIGGSACSYIVFCAATRWPCVLNEKLDGMKWTNSPALVSAATHVLCETSIQVKWIFRHLYPHYSRSGYETRSRLFLERLGSSV